MGNRMKRGSRIGLLMGLGIFLIAVGAEAAAEEATLNDNSPTAAVDPATGKPLEQKHDGKKPQSVEARQGDAANSGNTATGTGALQNNTTGNFNTATGSSALYGNTTGGYNTATGTDSLTNNISGISNTASGVRALFSNTTGDGNTAIGTYALQDNKGNYNTAVGYLTLQFNTTGDENDALGFMALYKNTTGTRNVAIGHRALMNNTGPTPALDKGGTSNTAVGWQALQANTTGWQNTAIGESALTRNTTGQHNTATGEDALYNNNGNHNTATGESTLYNNVSGNDNVANGYYALNLTTGSNNTAIGTQSGCNQTTGSNNIYVGNAGVAAESGIIRIGKMTAAAMNCSNGHVLPAQTSTYIAGIYGVNVTGSAVYVTSSGQLGVQSSSRRFKEEIRPLGSIEERIMKLRPVSFRYRDADGSGTKPLQLGLIAEEVAEIMPEMVQFDKDGKPFAIHYQFLAPLLLAALQREHLEDQAQQAALETLKEQYQMLRNELAELRKKK